MIEVENLTWYY